MITYLQNVIEFDGYAFYLSHLFFPFFLSFFMVGSLFSSSSLIDGFSITCIIHIMKKIKISLFLNAEKERRMA